MKIGFQVSSIRDYVKTPADVMESFRRIKGLGYDEVQIQYVDPAVTAEDIHSALAANSLTCIGTQDDYPNSLSALDSVIRSNNIWGSDYICSALWPRDCIGSDGRMVMEKYRLFAEEMAGAGKKVREAGKIFMFHPLFFDLLPVDGVVPLDLLLERVEGLQVTLDIYHVVAAGLDPAATIAKYRGNMDIVHFKESKTADGKQVVMPIGQGDTDWRPVIKACLDAGVKYCFIEQEQWHKDVFECMEDSLRYVNGLLGEMG